MNNPNRLRTVLPILMIVSGGILLLVIAFLLLQPAPLPALPGPTPTPDVARISAVEAGKAYNAQSAIFIDVRDADSYAAGHITGALNVPVLDVLKHLNELPKTAWIIAYCT
jgi:hypothetical protein